MGRRKKKHEEVQGDSIGNNRVTRIGAVFLRVTGDTVRPTHRSGCVGETLQNGMF
jgi:hypothetical protein